MGRADHLHATRWKPGQSGNPKGRTPRKRFREAFEAELQKPAPADHELVKPGERITQIELLARVFVQALENGQLWAWRAYLKREWPVTHVRGEPDAGSWVDLVAEREKESRTRPTREGSAYQTSRSSC